MFFHRFLFDFQFPKHRSVPLPLLLETRKKRGTGKPHSKSKVLGKPITRIWKAAHAYNANHYAVSV